MPKTKVGLKEFTSLSIIVGILIEYIKEKNNGAIPIELEAYYMGIEPLIEKVRKEV